jgi:PAS domain S-box-containing protein
MLALRAWCGRKRTSGSLSLAIDPWGTSLATGTMPASPHAGAAPADLVVSTDPIRRALPDGGLPHQASVLEQINDAVIAVDTAERVTYLNGAATRLYGVSRERALGQPLRLIVGYRFTDAAVEQEARDALSKKGVWRGGNIHVRLDGTSVHVESTVSLLKDEHGTPIGMLAIVRDVTERYDAAALQKRSEERFRAAVGAVNGVLWTNNAEGKMEGDQPAWGALTGQSYEEYQGFGWTAVVHPDDVQPTLDAWSEAVATRHTYVCEHRVRRHDGQWRQFAIRAIPVLNADGSVREWVGVHTDVTDGRRADDRAAFLRALADRLRDISDPRAVMAAAAESLGRHLNVGRCGYGEVDSTSSLVTVERDWTDGSMASAAGVYRLENYGNELFADLRAGRTVRVEDSQADARMTREAATAHMALGGMRASLVLPLLKRGRFAALLYVHQTDARRWTDEDEAVVHEVAERTWAAVERARAESALRESDRRFRLMADAAPVLIWISDTSKACIWFNRSWLEFTGRAMDQELGSGWLQGMHPADLERYLSTYTASFDGKQAFSMDYRLRRRDSEFRWMVAQGVPLFEGPGGAFSGYIGSCIDITDRKRAEDSLREADRRKDEFLATLAHELRNPLAPIRQAVRIARSPQVTEAQLRWSHDVIERQATHMSLLLGDLLDAARITEGKLDLRKENVELAAIIDTAIETARPLLDARRQRLHITMPTWPVPLHVDALRLAQVVANLLTNAAKYSHADGSIALSASLENEGVVIRVRDSGIGIESSMLARVFDMFSQATSALDRSEGGLGIGLAIVKGIVVLHGGSVEAQSAGPGKGSEFIVRLPHSLAAPEGVVRQSDDVAAAQTEPGLSIVIADDNRDSAESLKMLLEIDGHCVRTAHDGAQALELVSSVRPRVALLDIGMPRLNGYEVAAKIREQPWGTSIMLVAFTGWGQSQDRQRALDAGFDHHLTKPVDHESVLSLLRLAQT